MFSLCVCLIDSLVRSFVVICLGSWEGNTEREIIVGGGVHRQQRPSSPCAMVAPTRDARLWRPSGQKFAWQNEVRASTLSEYSRVERNGQARRALFRAGQTGHIHLDLDKTLAIPTQRSYVYASQKRKQTKNCTAPAKLCYAALSYGTPPDKRQHDLVL